MKADELLVALNTFCEISGEWPTHYFVDADTYANACQAVFDRLIKTHKDQLHFFPISLGINNGLMFRGTELILDEEKK